MNDFEIQRIELSKSIRQALRQNPVTALIGPRQCGKTALARQLAAQEPHEYFDLEAPSDLERLANPMTTLEPLKGLVVVDEVQRKPDLFPLLRVLSDRRPLPARFLLLGSTSPDLIRNSSESLAGRVAFVSMAGFRLAEVGPIAGGASRQAKLSAGRNGGGGVHHGAAGEAGNLVTTAASGTRE